MRRSCSVFLVFLFSALACSNVYAGNEEMRIDPYERIYGRRLSAQAPLAKTDISLSSEAAARMRSRTEEIIEQAVLQSWTLRYKAGLSAGSGQLPDLAQEIDEQLRRSRALISEGRYEAAYLESERTAYLHEFLGRLVVGARELSARRGGSRYAPAPVLNSRVPEAREKLDALHRELSSFTPKTASQLLSLIYGYAMWHDMRALLDVFDQNPEELIAVFMKEFKLTDGSVGAHIDKEQLGRLLLESLLLPIVTLEANDAKLRIELSRLDNESRLAPLTRRMEEAQLRRLAIAYGDAAQYNFNRLGALAAGRTLPPLPAVEEAFRAIGVVMIDAREKSAEQHKTESGMDATLRLLAANVETYIDSLYSLGSFEVRRADAESLAGSDSTSTATATAGGDRVLSSLIFSETRRALSSAAGVRSELGYVPIAAALHLRGGIDAENGDRDDRKRAYGYLIWSNVELELARALSNPPPCPEESETCETQSAKRDHSADIRACIQMLRSPSTGVISQAQGRARKKPGLAESADIDNLILEAIERTCLQAKDPTVEDSLRALFWRKFDSAIASWYRHVIVEERKAEQLYAACPTPEEQLREREQEEEEGVRADRVRQVLCDLDEQDRKIIEMHIRQDKTFKEIGWTLGISEDGARKRFNRASERFRQRWGKPPEFSWWFLLPTENRREFAAL